MSNQLILLCFFNVLIKKIKNLCCLYTLTVLYIYVQFKTIPLHSVWLRQDKRLDICFINYLNPSDMTLISKIIIIIIWRIITLIHYCFIIHSFFCTQKLLKFLNIQVFHVFCFCFLLTTVLTWPTGGISLNKVSYPVFSQNSVENTPLS